MMKRFLFLSLITVSFFSCKKAATDPGGCTFTESSFVAPASEVAALQTYINSTHPAAIQHSSGLFYEITTPGTGTVTPGVCSTVVVKYQGYLTNGTKFNDSNTAYPDGISFVLGGLILGWQKGIPLIKKGGLINLYVPPSLAYGAAGSGSTVPPNSNLVFVIQLVDVK